MRASAVAAITILVLVSGGCKYISVLRRQGVDLTRRRQAVIVREAEEIVRALTELSSEPGITDETETAFIPRDLTDLDEAEAIEVVATVLESTAKIQTAAKRSDAWLRTMQTDLRPIPNDNRIELDSDAEHDAYTSYCGLSDSKAYTLQWIRGGLDALGRIRRALSWTYRVIKWGGAMLILLLAAFGLWSWRRGRGWHCATRDAMDVIDLAKQANGFVAGKATADKPALKCAYERDRTWRTKRKG